jgi:hypothetical protein
MKKNLLSVLAVSLPSLIVAAILQVGILVPYRAAQTIKASRGPAIEKADFQDTIRKNSKRYLVNINH